MTKTMQRYLVFTTALAFSCSGLPAAEKSTSAKSPNIVLILTDDHGWSQMSQVMDSRVPTSVSNYLETPNMNRLAGEGMRFTNGYSPRTALYADATEHPLWGRHRPLRERVQEQMGAR
jgi:hypothetical protein